MFGFLSPQDRRNVKLVCKRWYDACNVVSLINSERIIICPKSTNKSNLTDVMKTLTKSKMKFYNLEFRRMRLERTTSFWRTCGRKILFLHFVDCKLNENTIDKLMTYCINIRHLSWKYLSPNDSFSKDVEISGCLLKSLISKDAFSKTLSSVEIDMWNINQTSELSVNDFFVQLIRRYPHLQSLHLKLIPGPYGSMLLKINEELFLSWAKSRLRHLCIERGQLFFDADTSSIGKLPANRTLKSLRLVPWRCDPNVQLCFVQKFLGLKYLEFTDIGDDIVLQNIWQNQARNLFQCLRIKIVCCDVIEEVCVCRLA